MSLLLNLLSCESKQTDFKESREDDVDSLILLAGRYRGIDIDSMIILSQNAVVLADEVDYEEGKLKADLTQAIGFFYKGEDSLCYEQIKKIEADRQPNKASDLIFAQANSLKGSLYQNRDLFDSAAIYMFEALHIFEKYDDSISIANVAANLSNNYILMGDYLKAMEFIQKAAHIFEKKDYKEGLSAVYERQGSIYGHQRNSDSALHYFKQSLDIAQDIKHAFLVANGMYNIGSVYMEEMNYELGQSYLQKSAIAYKELNNQLGYAMAISNIAQIAYIKGNYQKALENQERVNQIALANDFLHLQADSYLSMSQIFEEKKTYQIALKYRKLYEVISDSIDETEQLKTVKSLEHKYLTSQKDKVILKQELKIQKSQMNTLYGGLIFIIIITTLTLLMLKRRNENRQLQEKNEWIKNQQRELKHRTENHLEQLSDLFKIYTLTNQDNHSIVREANCRIEAINSVYKSLEKSPTNIFEIKPFLDNIIDKVFIIYGIKRSDVQLKMNIADVKVDADKALLIGQLTNEILNNSLKHAFDFNNSSSMIEVEFTELNKKEFQLVLRDNGIGFTQERSHSEDKMGLLLINTFIKTLRGIMIQESNEKGTAYYITFEKE